MKQVLFLFITLFIVAFVKGATNSTGAKIEQPTCIYANSLTSNDRIYYSYILPAKYACEDIGFTINFCDAFIPEIVEISNRPNISYNNNLEITFIGEDSVNTKTLTQKLLDSVKGPNQYFLVPEEAQYLSSHIKIKFDKESDMCENSEKFEKIIVQVYGVKKFIEMNDDDISEELEQLCYNNVIPVPFNIILDDEKYKKNLIDDLKALESDDEIVITKLLTASYVSKDGDPDQGLCRGFLYLKAMNDCNKIRLEEVKGSKQLSKQYNDVIKMGDKAPKFIKDCVRELTVKPTEKPDYSKAKTVEEGDWFVKMEL
ncbi:hypothetical protein BCR36DRAFT_359528 [Piromyces finnis]|uniref:Secreted protein n=1 Tax=Piromyces finnis TaxID=1754191 RepID=A0A1Y1V0V2_9FUNG|nr:hypothetical protein BCR36DRAFT_359528 [Piromyces finnis]|eukprot:ORX44737.1 hypothetical protein BCR36DRAFT_359528 [Piromyces finnis]